MTWLSLIFLCLLLLLALKHYLITFGQVAVFGLATKLIGGVAFGLIYKLYYDGGDTWAIWTQVQAFNLEFAKDPADYFSALFATIDPYSGNPRSVFFLRVLSPLALFTGHNYWLVTSYLALFSFCTTWGFIGVLSNIFSAHRTWIILVIGFLPSFIFWSSGISKEALANGCLFYALTMILHIYSGHKLPYSQLPLFLLAFFILFMTRHYLAGVFTFVSISILIDKYLPLRTYWSRILAFLLVMAFGLFFIRFFYIRLRPERFPVTFYELHEEIKRNSNPDDMVHFDLAPTWSSVISNLPKSTFSGLFRPLPGDTSSPWSFMIITENTLLLIAFILTIINYKKIKWRPSLIFFALLFILVLATILPLTTPNFGSLSRYKSSYLPLLFLVFSVLPFQLYLRKHIRIL